MTEHTPFIDFENLPDPKEGFAVTLFITVRSVARSRAFYSEVLGGQVVLEENPCIVKLANSWVVMNPGGPPTPDKPDISVVDHDAGDTVSSFMNLRVADIQAWTILPSALPRTPTWRPGLVGSTALASSTRALSTPPTRSRTR